MTLQEFSDLFDILYSSETDSAETIDEYLKSVYLTKAQYQILLLAFNPMLDLANNGFDGNTKRQIDFSTLMRTAEIVPEAVTTSPYPSLTVFKVSLEDKKEGATTTDQRERLILFFINEMVVVTRKDNSERVLQVIPISHDEITRILSKPYGQPLKRNAWRLLLITNRISTIDLINQTGANIDPDLFIQNLYLIVHPNETATKYTVNYVKRPQPIILLDLSDTKLTIDGINTQSNCELDPSIHLEILERAVSLAKLAANNQTATTAANELANNRRLL